MKHQSLENAVLKAGFQITCKPENRTFFAENKSNGKNISWIEQNGNALAISKGSRSCPEGFIAHDSRLKSLIKFLKDE